jgi:5-methylcytosine-specific restriction enzyme A
MWWERDQRERFWLEATDRADIGADLKAPETDDSGQANWRYTLLKNAQPGDVVLHYDKRPGSNGIVGWSVVSGRWRREPIVWAARGTYARGKRTRPTERPGFVVPLEGFQRLSTPITLDRVRNHAAAIRALLELHRQKYKAPAYFPFELSPKRPIRLLQGYAFKLPRAFLNLFPELSILLDGESNPESEERVNHRNAPWTRDELILALELYLRDPASPPNKSSPEVIELSAFLNELGRVLGHGEAETFRNPNGVYMKMINFRRFDPAFTAAGKVGLTRGNKEEEQVWADFAHDPERLRKIANAIRQATLLNQEELSATDDEEGITEAEEGRLLTRIHRTRERSRKLVEERKLKALQELGRLCCEVCTFDFEQTYGERGRGFIEAHHTRPVETLVQGSKTKLEELALLCANCHRMVHSARPWLTIEELRKLLLSSL